MAKRHRLAVSELREVEIPRLFWKLESETYFGDPDALEIVNRYARKFETAIDEGMGLLLFGPTGSLKTFLATHLLKCLMVENYNVRYLTIDSLQVKAISNTIPDLVSESDHLIVLDDVNRPSSSSTGPGWQVNLLRKAIRFRTEYHLPLVICTQLTSEEFGQLYGMEVANRVVSNLLAVKCESQSTAEEIEKRLKKRARRFLED